MLFTVTKYEVFLKRRGNYFTRIWLLSHLKFDRLFKGKKIIDTRPAVRLCTQKENQKQKYFFAICFAEISHQAASLHCSTLSSSVVTVFCNTLDLGQFVCVTWQSRSGSHSAVITETRFLRHSKLSLELGERFRRDRTQRADTRDRVTHTAVS